MQIQHSVGNTVLKYLYGYIIISGILARVLALRASAKSMVHVLNQWWEWLSKELSSEKTDQQKTIPEHRNHIKVSKPPVGTKKRFSLMFSSFLGNVAAGHACLMVSTFHFGPHIKCPSRELRTSVLRNNLNTFYPSEMLPAITSNLAYLTNHSCTKEETV